MYRILIAGLEERGLRGVFKPEGFEVMSSPDAGSAVPLAAREKPDMVLLDGRAGLDACRALRVDPRTRHIPVVMLDGESAEESFPLAALEAGAEDYLSMPTAGRALLARVRSILAVTAGPLRA